MKDLDQIIQGSLEELKQRWELARYRAIYKTNPTIKSEQHFFENLNSLEEQEYDEVLKNIFLYSRQLGDSYQVKFRLSWERSDFQKYLQQLGSPCFKGTMRSNVQAVILERSGCTTGVNLGGRYCNYWREALDGIILGLSDCEHYVRHKSVGNGEDKCVDIVYTQENNLNFFHNREFKWGVISEKYKEGLDNAVAKFKRMGVELEFLGIKESNLYYILNAKKMGACGAGETIFIKNLQSFIKEIYPDLILKDASPIAVISEEAF